MQCRLGWGLENRRWEEGEKARRQRGEAVKGVRDKKGC